MTTGRGVRCLALLALAAAIHVSTTASAAAYTFTFRLPMTINQVGMETVSLFCKNVGWGGEANSGQTVTLDSAPGCLVKHIYIRGRYNGKPVDFDFPIPLTFMTGADIHDQNGGFCISHYCFADIEAVIK